MLWRRAGSLPINVSSPSLLSLITHQTHQPQTGPAWRNAIKSKHVSFTPSLHSHKLPLQRLSMNLNLHTKKIPPMTTQDRTEKLYIYIRNLCLRHELYPTTACLHRAVPQRHRESHRGRRTEAATRRHFVSTYSFSLLSLCSFVSVFIFRVDLRCLSKTGCRPTLRQFENPKQQLAAMKTMSKKNTQSTGYLSSVSLSV